MDYGALERAGLTASEVKVYVALLDLGSSTVGPITAAAAVASSKTYELLDKLMRKGLVTTYLENNTRHYTAVNPRRIKEYILERQSELVSNAAALDAILPSLEARFADHAGDTAVELFKGYKGVETIFNEMFATLKRGDEFLVTGGGDSPSANERTRRFFERIHRKRAEKGIKLKIIFSEARRSSANNLALFPLTYARYLPYGTPSTINVYKNTVFLLIMSPTPAAIRVRDTRIAASYRAYFEELWKLAKK